MQIAMTLNLDDFSASNGWLESWQRRHNVKFSVLSGEAAGVSRASVENWTKRLPDLIKGYDPKDIFNADETGLFNRALPKQSMVIRSDPCKGVKCSKDRITVLLACSAAGENEAPCHWTCCQPQSLQGNHPCHASRHLQGQQEGMDDREALLRVAGQAEPEHEAPEEEHPAVGGQLSIEY